MTGKGRELVKLMQRRKVYILCVQETRSKGSKDKSLIAGFKLFYHGEDIGLKLACTSVELQGIGFASRIDISTHSSSRTYLQS